MSHNLGRVVADGRTFNQARVSTSPQAPARSATRALSSCTSIM